MTTQTSSKKTKPKTASTRKTTKDDVYGQLVDELKKSRQEWQESMKEMTDKYYEAIGNLDSAKATFVTYKKNPLKQVSFWAAAFPWILAGIALLLSWKTGECLRIPSIFEFNCF